MSIDFTSQSPVVLGHRSNVPSVAAVVARPVNSLRGPDESPDTDDLPPASTLEDHLNNVSKCVWGIQNLRTMQLDVLLKILTLSLSNRKVLNIAHTGGGKTHIIRVLGTYARAVHLVIHPILALTADQVLKFMEGTDKYGAIDAHNMDASPNALRKQIIAKMRRLAGDTTTTLFIFVSPQTLAGDKSFLDAVIKCAMNGTLRSVVTDEAHLLAVQGASFVWRYTS